MKNYLLAPLSFVLLIPSFAKAQTDSTDTDNGKFIRVVSISAYGGGDTYRDGFEDRTIFQQGAPTSTLAFVDLGGYTNERGLFYFNQTGITNGININLHLRCQQKYGELRFGISHNRVNVASQSYSMSTVTTVDSDTLSNGEIFYTDSIALSSYRYNWNSDILHLNIGWIVRTDPRRWVNLYTGFGVFAGLGFNGIITATQERYSHRSTYGNVNSNYSYESDFENEIIAQEQFRAPSFTSIGAYVPIGFNVRLGRRNDFLKHLTVFGEYNGAVQFLAPKGTDSKIRTVSSMYGGARWYIHAPAGKQRHWGEHRRERQEYQRGDGMQH
jgi:hypothetical protein